VNVNYRHLAGALALSAAIATAACGDDPPPTQPTPAPTPAPPPANPVLTAPTVDSPAEDEQLSTLRPTLVVRKASSDQVGPRSYEFQVSDDPDFQAASAPNLARHYRLVAAQSGIPEGPNDATFNVAADLQPATRFYWRARARQGTVDGPWSARSTFRTRVAAYNLAGELYDPLTTGTTLGQVVGNVTLTPGRGATINTNESHIRYQLVQTVTAGELSMEVDGIQNNSPGDKTKIMAMYDGNGDITTSDYRATIEKRDGGVIAWRFIAGEVESDAQIETVGQERVAINFNPGQTYLWRTSWGNHFFRLEIFHGPTTGDRIYEFGKPYEGTYDPTPHIAYVGSPIGRAGPDDASVVGATWRNVYLGSAGRPRPSSLGTALIEDPSQDPRIKNRGVRATN
jgi:hypothetical protein